MEDMLGNYAGVRQIFERWMEWEPDDNAWNSYIKFEVRHKEFERARMIYRRCSYYFIMLPFVVVVVVVVVLCFVCFVSFWS